MAKKVVAVVKSERLVRIMYDKQLTARTLGKLAGVADNTISRMIRNEHSPHPKVIQKVCKALEVEFDEIFEIVTIEGKENKVAH